MISVRSIATVLLMAGIAACRDEPGSAAGVLSPGDLPPGEMTFGLHHVMTKEGVRNAILEADTAFKQQSGQRFDLRQVRLQFFTETGAESGTLTSRSGEYTPGDGSFVARDSVVLITLSEKGTRHLETPELFYDVSTEQIWSDTTFLLREPDGVYRGRSFRSAVNGDEWTAVGLVTEDLPTGDAGIAF